MLLDRATLMNKHMAVDKVTKVAFNIFLRKWEGEIVQGKKGKMEKLVKTNFVCIRIIKLYSVLNDMFKHFI